MMRGRPPSFPSRSPRAPRRGRAPTRWVAPIVLAVLADAGGAARALAASPHAANEQGNALYREGKYAEARDRYLSAQADRPDAPQLDVNIGNSFYQEGEFENAIASYAKALSRAESGKETDRRFAPTSAYNLGNALFKGAKMDEAIEAYKKALRANPADLDAKHNLEFALKKKEEEKKDSEQKNQEEKQEDDKQKSDEKKDGGEEKKDQDQQGKPDEPKDEKENEENRDGDKPKPPQGADSSGAPPQQPKPEEVRGMPREDAMRILEALEAQEMADAKREEKEALIRALQSSEKDW